MKKLLILFFSAWSISIYCQTSVTVNYETVRLVSNLKLNGFKITEEQKQEMERKILKENKIPEKYVLYAENGNTFFQNDPNEKISPYKQKTELFRFKNKKGCYALEDYLVETFYGYYPTDDIVNIEYSNETQTIENYLCKLAIYTTANTISKVWYTDEIPVSAGPYIYYKVPGLVLKVENSQFLCYATKVSKSIKKNDLKKMDPTLKIYEGEELKIKNIEGKDKMLNNSRQQVSETMKNQENK
jgi:GLPGLI family protein